MMPKLAPYSKALSYAYAPGIFPSHALLDSQPDAARRLLVHSGAGESEGVQALIDRCEALGVRVETADHALSRISQKENCYAAIVFDKYEQVLRPDSPHILLHHPSDMGNLGSILRTCVGFGLSELAIVRPGADIFDPRVVRASMGALFASNVVYYEDFDAYREAFPGHELYPFMLDGSQPLKDAAKTRKTPYTLIFGNEATGLPASFAQAGQPVRIPHNDRIDSLNLSVAVAIGAYAFTEEEPQ